MREPKNINKSRYQVGCFDVFPERNVIQKNGKDISVEPRVMDVLGSLAAADGEVVSRDALIELHWDTHFGADESLTRIISRLRKSFRDAGESTPYIETISKRGYRLVCEVEWHHIENEVENGEHADNSKLNSGIGTPHLREAPQSWFQFWTRFKNTFRNRKFLYSGIGVTSLVLATALPQAINSYTLPGSFINQDPPSSIIIPSDTNQVINPNSIAVLPFMDMSAAKDQEFFSDGIAEEILNVLSRVDGLKVASRTSSFQFKEQKSIGIPAIADQLHVRYVLQGSVRKVGDSIRITTQLIEASSDQHIWSSTFNRTLTAENIFAIQEEIAIATVEALENRLNDFTKSIGESPTIAVKTNSVDAYEAFLKARVLYQNRTSIHEAEDLLVQSLSLDPEFAEAWALRSAVYTVVYAFGRSFGDDTQSDRQQSRVFAQRALDLQPDNVLALASLAFGDTLDLLEGKGDKTFTDVIAAFNRALAVNPNSIDVLNWRGIQMMRAGYFDQAIADYSKCIEIDRAAAPCRYNLMAGYAANDQSEQAVRVLYEALDYGVFSQDTLVLLVLSEIERRDLFLFAAGWNPQLRGWHGFGQLYDALQKPDQDHSALREQLADMFERNGINELASDMLLSALGATDVGAAGALWWFDTHEDFRQTTTFKQKVKDMGIYDYWLRNGFPPQCAPDGSSDFTCA